MRDDILTTRQRAPSRAPSYAAHRLGVDAADAAAPEDNAQGLNCDGFERVHVQVVPSGGANPEVEILWWSEKAGVFVKENPTFTRVGFGADVPFEFTVEARGRCFFVLVTALAAGSVDILASGS